MNISPNFQKENESTSKSKYKFSVSDYDDEDLQSIIDVDDTKRKEVNYSTCSQFILNKDIKNSGFFSKKSGHNETITNKNDDIKTSQYESYHNPNSPKSIKVHYPVIINEIKNNPGVKLIDNDEVDSLNVLLENKKQVACASCIIGNNNNVEADSCFIF